MENLEPKTRFEYFLNKIAENGGSSDDSGSGFGEGGVLVVGVIMTQDGNTYTYTLTKTYREIKNAVIAVIAEETGDGTGFYRSIWMVTSLEEHAGLYTVSDSQRYFNTDNIDGYPSLSRYDDGIN